MFCRFDVILELTFEDNALDYCLIPIEAVDVLHVGESQHQLRRVTKQ